jgi:hypothetical protein
VEINLQTRLVMVGPELHPLYLEVLSLTLEAGAEAMRGKPLVERQLMVVEMAVMGQGLLLLEPQIVAVVAVGEVIRQMVLEQQAAQAS